MGRDKRDILGKFVDLYESELIRSLKEERELKSRREKSKDLGCFIIPCTIGKSKFDTAMLDLRALINVMPYFVFSILNIGDLKKKKLGWLYN